MIFCKGAAVTKMQTERNDMETTAVETMLKVPCAGELLGAAVGLVRAADSNSRTNEGTFALLIKAFSLLKQFAEESKESSPQSTGFFEKLRELLK